MDTIKEGAYEDTNRMFQPPVKVNYHVKKWFKDTDQQLTKVVENYIRTQKGLPTERL